MASTMSRYDRSAGSVFTASILMPHPGPDSISTVDEEISGKL